jgi:hypothetical protein
MEGKVRMIVRLKIKRVIEYRNPGVVAVEGDPKSNFQAVKFNLPSYASACLWLLVDKSKLPKNGK